MKSKPKPKRTRGEVLYQGIAARTFERTFQLAEHVEVKGASLENGLLHVDLVREVPEAEAPTDRHQRQSLNRRGCRSESGVTRSTTFQERAEFAPRATRLGGLLFNRSPTPKRPDLLRRR